MRIALLTIVLVSLLNQSPQAATQQIRELEMTVRVDANADSQFKIPKSRAELRNVGEHDLILNLGIMLTNGSKQYPNAVVLTIVDSEGKARRFELREPLYIAGRMDPLIVPLPIGSAFSVPVEVAGNATLNNDRNVKALFRGAGTPWEGRG